MKKFQIISPEYKSGGRSCRTRIAGFVEQKYLQNSIEIKLVMRERMYSPVGLQGKYNADKANKKRIERLAEIWKTILNGLHMQGYALKEHRESTFSRAQYDSRKENILDKEISVCELKKRRGLWSRIIGRKNKGHASLSA